MLYMEKIDNSFIIEIPWIEISYVEIYTNKLKIYFKDDAILINLPSNFNVMYDIEKTISEKTKYAHNI